MFRRAQRNPKRGLGIGTRRGPRICLGQGGKAPPENADAVLAHVENPREAAARARIDVVTMLDQPDSVQDRTRPANTCTCAELLGLRPKRHLRVRHGSYLATTARSDVASAYVGWKKKRKKTSQTAVLLLLDAIVHPRRDGIMIDIKKSKHSGSGRPFLRRINASFALSTWF